MSQDEQPTSPINRAAVNEIRQLIAQRQLTIAETAAAAGIPRSTLHAKLSLRTALTVGQLVQLAVALDVPVTTLLEKAARAGGITDPP